MSPIAAGPLFGITRQGTVRHLLDQDESPFCSPNLQVVKYGQLGDYPDCKRCLKATS